MIIGTNSDFHREGARTDVPPIKIVCVIGGKNLVATTTPGEIISRCNSHRSILRRDQHRGCSSSLHGKSTPTGTRVRPIRVRVGSTSRVQIKGGTWGCRPCGSPHRIVFEYIDVDTTLRAGGAIVHGRQAGTTGSNRHNSRNRASSIEDVVDKTFGEDDPGSQAQENS